MAQFEQTRTERSSAAERSARARASRDSTSQDRVERAEQAIAPAQRAGVMPQVAVLVALLFAAVAWLAYHQGQRDSLGAAAAKEYAAVASNPQFADARDAGRATTIVQSPSFGKPDILVTVHPSAAQIQAPSSSLTPTGVRLARAVRPAKVMPVVATKKLDREVALSSRPQPVYPAQALRSREQGTVLVLAQIDVNGRVSDARIVRRSGSNILDRAAPNEVRRWKFAPALHDGQPIVASVEVPVSYRLDQ